MPFGFEFELLIPVFSKFSGQLPAAKSWPPPPTPPAYLTVPPERASIDELRKIPPQQILSPEIGTALNGTLVASIEHQDRLNAHRSAKWPTTGENLQMTSLEIATKAMDETLVSHADVTAAMQGIAAWAVSLHQQVIGGAQLIDQFMDPEIAGVNFAGPAAGKENDRDIRPDAYVQETYGLRLDKVVEEFTQRAADLPAELRATTSWYGPLKMSSNIEPYAFTTKALEKFGNLGNPQAAKELRGFLTLIEYYSMMLKASQNDKTTGKNVFGVFYYKTQLSTVRNQLGQKYPAIATFLSHENNRQAVLEELKINSAWLDWGMGVLKGESDSLFLSSMNAYSEELFAPNLGPRGNQSVGVVVENRQFRVTYPEMMKAGGLNKNSMYAPSAWAGIATRLYDRLLRMHGMQQP